MPFDSLAACPACHQPTLPRFAKDSRATAVCCQNPQCRAVVDRFGAIEMKRSPIFLDLYEINLRTLDKLGPAVPLLPLPTKKNRAPKPRKKGPERGKGKKTKKRLTR